MPKTNYSFTLSPETVESLDIYAKSKYWSKSLAVENILNDFLSVAVNGKEKKKARPETCDAYGNYIVTKEDEATSAEFEKSIKDSLAESEKKV